MLAELRCDFPHPLFPGIDHRVEVRRDEDDRISVRLHEGRRVVCRLRARFVERRLEPVDPSGPLDPRAAARSWPRGSFERPVALEGTWAPRAGPFEALAAHLGLDARGVPAAQAEALVAMSHLVGMELPGRGALFSRLALTFPVPCPVGSPGLHWRVAAGPIDERLGLLTIPLSVGKGSAPVAQGEARAFVAANEPQERRTEPSAAESWSGKTAVVVGASRGLGAELARALAFGGADVTATYHRSTAAAEALAASCADAPGRLVCLQGDAADPDWCAGAAGLGDQPVDLLICSACPPLLPLWIEPEAVGRIGEHVRDATNLVAAPLAAWLPRMRSRGLVVALSSNALDDPVDDWPHYAAAKGAIEALLEVGAREYPELRFRAARLPRLKTDLTRTPLGDLTAIEPARVASELLTRLTDAADGPGPTVIRM